MEEVIGETHSLEKNHTLKLIRLLERQRTISSKRIFKKNERIPMIEEPIYKERIVVNSFTLMERIKYNEIFSPMVEHLYIRLVMDIMNQYNLELKQMDVKITSLHGDLEETIFMEQLEAFIEDKYNICLLKKFWYRLKQGSRKWYRWFVRSGYNKWTYILN